MIKLCKLLLSTLLLLLLMFVSAASVKASTNPIEAQILPSEGGADTTILLSFTTLNSSVGNVSTADIFWDNVSVGLNQQGVLGASGAYYYNLTVPTESPLSTQGNHTILVDSNVTNYGPYSVTFTFTITEFVPSPEYVTLNETYYSLLENYTQLLSNYTDLSANYTTLTAEHNTDVLNYNTLLANYNSLTANYNSVSANYNTLTNSYSTLTQSYSSLSSGYTGLQTNFQNLNSSYVVLIQDYNLLNGSYAGLLSNYNSVTGQLDSSRNLNYVLIITTIALAITTIYFAMLKPKKQQKTR